MAIWIDGDACPREVKDIVFRAGIKQQHQINFIANSYHRLPSSPWIKTYQVNKDPDAADLHIIEHIAPGDLLITSDIPLASEALKNGANSIQDDDNNIDSLKEKLQQAHLHSAETEKPSSSAFSIMAITLTVKPLAFGEDH